MPVQPRSRAQARRRVMRKGREYDPRVAVDPAQIGEQAVGLMDDLAEEELPEDAEIEVVGLAVQIRYSDEQGELRHVLMRCSDRNRVVQIGLFETAKHIALTSDDED